jgi:hypothetical protein
MASLPHNSRASVKVAPLPSEPETMEPISADIIVARNRRVFVSQAQNA